MAAVGTWNIGGFNLPDYKISERLGIGTPNPAFKTGLTSGVGQLTNQSQPAQLPSVGAPQPTLSGTSFNNSVNSGAIRVDSGPQTLGVQNTGNGGGGGDDELTKLRKIIGETGGNPGEQGRLKELESQLNNSAQNQSQIELEALMAEYDRQDELLRGQSASLDTQRLSGLDTLKTSYGRNEQEAGKAKTEATDSTNTAQRKLLSTAQDVQKSNRNVLRALGILSSSAAGEMLNKPLNEYQTQAGELQQGLVKRIGAVEDWLMQRTEDFSKATKDLESQYADLKEKISGDLRFNGTQRAQAVRAAKGALQQRMAEIQQQVYQYETAAKQYSDNLLTQVAQIQMYQNPSADVSGILSTLLSRSQGGGQTTQTELSAFQPKKKLGEL